MHAMHSPPRLIAALSIGALWTLVTVFGLNAAGDGGERPLLDTVSHGISWNLVMAIGVLAVATALMRWRDLGFVAPRSAAALKLLWFPSLYLALFAAIAWTQGLPPPRTLVFVLANTVLVGLSEEWMFRGVLLQALRTRLALWPALLSASVLFGSVHLLNVLVTGQLLEAAVQALAAFLSGTVFTALLVRTGSIWVPITYHALWDFGTFTSIACARASGDAPDLSQGWTWTLPILLVLPNFLYALFLLRNVHGRSGSESQHA